MVVWVDPSWRFPGVASKLYKDMLWDKEIVNVVFKNSTLVEGGTRPWGDNVELTDDELREKAVELIRRVWRNVDEDRLGKDGIVKYTVSLEWFSRDDGDLHHSEYSLSSDIAGRTTCSDERGRLPTEFRSSCVSFSVPASWLEAYGSMRRRNSRSLSVRRNE
jgi:hypothetical protein